MKVQAKIDFPSITSAVHRSNRPAWSFRVTVCLCLCLPNEEGKLPRGTQLANPPDQQGPGAASECFQPALPWRREQAARRPTQIQQVGPGHQPLQQQSGTGLGGVPLHSQCSHHGASHSFPLPKYHGSCQPADLGTCFLAIRHTEPRRPEDCSFWWGRALAGLTQLPE